MYLVAFVKDIITGETRMMEDTDYDSKSDFASDLRRNELSVISIADNRDLYVMDHSNYPNINQLKKDMKHYKDLGESFESDYEGLKDLYDKAMKQPLDRKLDNYID